MGSAMTSSLFLSKMLEVSFFLSKILKIHVVTGPQHGVRNRKLIVSIKILFGNKEVDYSKLMCHI